jgi:hypothetical protein
MEPTLVTTSLGIPGAWLLGTLGWGGIAIVLWVAAGLMAWRMSAARQGAEGAAGGAVDGVGLMLGSGAESHGSDERSDVLRGASIDVHTIEEVEARVLLLSERAVMEEGDRLIRIEFTVTPGQTRAEATAFASGVDASEVVYDPMRFGLHARALPQGVVGAATGRAEGRAVRMTPIRDDGTPMRELFVDRPQRFEGLFATPRALVGRSVFVYGEETFGDLCIPEAFDPPALRAA